MTTTTDTDLITRATCDRWEREIEAALCLAWMSANGFADLATRAAVSLPELRGAIHKYVAATGGTTACKDPNCGRPGACGKCGYCWQCCKCKR